MLGGCVPEPQAISVSVATSTAPRAPMSAVPRRGAPAVATGEVMRSLQAIRRPAARRQRQSGARAPMRSTVRPTPRFSARSRASAARRLAPSRARDAKDAVSGKRVGTNRVRPCVHVTHSGDGDCRGAEPSTRSPPLDKSRRFPRRLRIHERGMRRPFFSPQPSAARDLRLELGAARMLLPH
jgi:hypothetical protein